MASGRANRLAKETSPYLLQHAHNPVDWYPWGPEAFDLARREKRPVLLSVGYSACHWCHVMEHESFENEAIARQMNEQFVNIKVDREERPDVDEIYMQSVQLLTGRGGWPMTVFLTPEGEPFYGGTYFPPEDRHGMPGFPRVLTAVAEAWRERPNDVRQTVQRLLGAMQRLETPGNGAAELDPGLLDRAVDALSRAYDSRHGGLGRAPKFPNTLVFSLFLRAAHATGRRELAAMTADTLRHMAAGGIFDHLGGGFHRYSVDERWLVPHFEKMLYDNAQLTSLCLETFRATGDRFFLGIAEDVLRYVTREMLAPGGGFYSTQDADSEGEEGRFFLWDSGEVTRLLGEETGEIFCRVYDVTDVGNFEHRNILHRTIDDEQAARMFRKEPSEISRLLAEARQRLFEERERRVKPFRDEKILLAWNGLMLSAYADAYRITGNASYREVAERTVGFVEERLTRGGRLLHSFKDGEAKVNAFLDDTAAFGLALLDLFEATFDTGYLVRAEKIGESMLGLFWDETGGGFFFTASDHERLVVRTKPAYDGSVPSGNSLATQLCLRLYHLTGREEFRDRAERVLRLYHDAMAENPFGYANLIAALDFHVRGPKEVVIVAPGGPPRAAPLLEPLARLYAPNRIVFCYDPNEPPERVPVFAHDKPAVDSRPTAYVCHRSTCSAPVTEWDALRSEIEESR